MPRLSRLPSLGARLLVTVAALAGLFAMHGMADHGVPATPFAATAAGHEGGHTAGHMDGVVAGGTAGHHDPATPSGHGSSEVCVALLALSFALLAALGCAWPAFGPPRRATVRWRSLAPRARFRDPPDLFRLSLQRC